MTSTCNNTVVLVDDIGEEENALLCITNNADCCSGSIRAGEFYFPNSNSPVLISREGGDFYRNRGTQLIRLNRRNGATSPTGIFRCEIPDAKGVMQNMLINIGMLT